MNERPREIRVSIDQLGKMYNLERTHVRIEGDRIVLVGYPPVVARRILALEHVAELHKPDPGRRPSARRARVEAPA